MKITILNGSPNKDDILAETTASVSDKLKAAGAEVKDYFLYFMNIKGCINCGVTRPDDELRLLADEFVSSDVVIFASPLYKWTLSGSLNILMEEIFQFCKYDMRSGEMTVGKRSFGIISADADTDADEASRSLKAFSNNLEMLYEGTLMVSDGGKEDISRFAEIIMKK